MSFEGKTVVVTGGTGALGRAVCAAFLSKGATVHASYMDEKEKESMAHYERLQLQKVNLTDESEVQQWFESIGIHHVLINVVGGFAMGPFVETSFQSWKFLHQLNLDTVFLSCRASMAHLDKSYGRIINVAAYAATGKSAHMSAYASSKAGVMKLTEVLAEETLNSGITVNAILPTVMDSPANRAAMPDANYGTWVPMQGVAETMCFLAQESSWHITGALIPLRGRV